MRQNVERARSAVDVLADSTLHTQRCELRRFPTNAAFTRLPGGILGEWLYDLLEFLGPFIKYPTNQQHIVVFRPTTARRRVSQVHFHAPAADMQVRVEQIRLAGQQ